MEKTKMIELEMDDSFKDNGLTRIQPGTNFVIEKRTGIVKFIFRKSKKDIMIERLVNNGIPLKQLKYNSYGDILIM